MCRRRRWVMGIPKGMGMGMGMGTGLGVHMQMGMLACVIV